MITLITALASVFLIAQPTPGTGPPDALFPNNVVCEDFQKTGITTWSLVARTDLDLGNWDGAMHIEGAITPGRFIRGGADLYDVLERRCNITYQVQLGDHMDIGGYLLNTLLKSL